LRNGFRPRTVQTAEGELEVEIPQVREAAETFASKLFPRTPKLLRTEPLKALVIGAFVRGLSMRDVESLCEQGLGDHAIVSPDEDAKALEVALELACRAHRGQRYPSPEREPYVLHLLRVMLAVDGFRVQAAAVLHDVLEDTGVTVGELGAAGLPIDVVNAVVTLTQRPGQSYPRYIEQVARDAIAREVKLADLADNLANNKRLPNAPDVVARIERYEHAIRRLKEVSETSSK
jgi:Transposase, Mutator family